MDKKLMAVNTLYARDVYFGDSIKGLSEDLEKGDLTLNFPHLEFYELKRVYIDKNVITYKK